MPKFLIGDKLVINGHGYQITKIDSFCGSMHYGIVDLYIFGNDSRPFVMQDYIGTNAVIETDEPAPFPSGWVPCSLVEAMNKL